MLLFQRQSYNRAHMYCTNCGAELSNNAQGCWRCNTPVAASEPVLATAPNSIAARVNEELYGIGGWLLFFWISIGLAPFVLLASAIRAKATVPGAVSAGLAVLCAVIAVQMWRRNPNAIDLLRMFILIESARALLVIAIATYQLPFRVTYGSGRADYAVAAMMLARCLAWWLYFRMSLRVRNTFGKNI